MIYTLYSIYIDGEVQKVSQTPYKESAEIWVKSDCERNAGVYCRFYAAEKRG